MKARILHSTISGVATAQQLNLPTAQGGAVVFLMKDARTNHLNDA